MAGIKMKNVTFTFTAAALVVKLVPSTARNEVMASE